MKLKKPIPLEDNDEEDDDFELPEPIRSEDEVVEYDGEILKISFNGKELFLNSEKLSVKELKDLVLELLKQKDIRDFLNMNTDNKCKEEYLG